MIRITQHEFIELLKILPLEQLAWIEQQICAERCRRDICEHGVATGEWREAYNRAYKLAATSHAGKEN